jgi:uncharacterized protein YqgC (DUF456 family)
MSLWVEYSLPISFLSLCRVPSGRMFFVAISYAIIKRDMTSFSGDPLLFAWILMGLGLLCTFVPLLPGPPIVWLGALFYAWQTNYARVGPVLLVLLASLAIAGSTSDIWASAIGARKGGASVWATVASIVGGTIGLFVLHIPGLFLGAIGGIALVEYRRHKSWNAVLKASGGYLVGYFISLVVQVVVCLVMMLIFAVAVYR